MHLATLLGCVISYKKGNGEKHFVVDVDVETWPESVAQQPRGT